MFFFLFHLISKKGDGLYNPKYRKGQHKESKQARRARNKLAKKNKFDPNVSETTREEKIRFENEQYDDDDDDDDEHSDSSHDEEMVLDNDDDDDDDNDSGYVKGNEKEDVHTSNVTTQSTPQEFITNPNQSRIEQLRAKLRAKLEEKRSQRPGTGSNSDTMVSKRAARRAEKKRKIELAKKKQANTGSNISKGSTQTGKTKQEKISLVKDLGGSTISETNAKTVVDDLSGIDFGGIAGLKNNLGANYIESNKSLKNKGKKKSLERLLAEAEAKKERLRQLKESDDAEDKEKAKSIMWGDTLKAARSVLEML